MSKPSVGVHKQSDELFIELVKNILQFMICSEKFSYLFHHSARIQRLYYYLFTVIYYAATPRDSARDSASEPPPRPSSAAGGTTLLLFRYGPAPGGTESARTPQSIGVKDGKV